MAKKRKSTPHVPRYRIGGHKGTNRMRSSRERDFTLAIIDLAICHRWICHHNFDSRRVHPSGAGLPDLIFVRDTQVIWAELKTGGRRRTDRQVLWANALTAAGQDVRLWTPDDWDEIAQILTAKRTGG